MQDMHVHGKTFCNVCVICICIIFIVCTFDKNMRHLPHIYQTYVKQVLICIILLTFALNLQSEYVQILGKCVQMYVQYCTQIQ